MRQSLRTTLAFRRPVTHRRLARNFEEQVSSPSNPSRRSRSAKVQATKRMSKSFEEEKMCLEEEMAEAIVIDGDTPTKKLQMVSRIFLKKINISEIVVIQSDKKKSKNLSKKDTARFKKIQRFNHNLGKDEDEEMELDTEVTPIIVDERWILELGAEEKEEVEDPSTRLRSILKVRSSRSSRVNMEKKRKRVRFS